LKIRKDIRLSLSITVSPFNTIKASLERTWLVIHVIFCNFVHHFVHRMKAEKERSPRPQKQKSPKSLALHETTKKHAKKSNDATKKSLSNSLNPNAMHVETIVEKKATKRKEVGNVQEQDAKISKKRKIDREGRSAKSRATSPTSGESNSKPLKNVHKSPKTKNENVPFTRVLITGLPQDTTKREIILLFKAESSGVLVSSSFS
jgi:hypothetical protein